MEPLRITFRLGTAARPPSHPLHFDSLIASLKVRENERNKASAPNEDWPTLDAILADLPFGKATGADGEWVWQASQLHWNWQGHAYHSFQSRKFDYWSWLKSRDQGVFDINRKLNGGSGEEKAFIFTHQLRYAASVTAWCVGDRHLIEGLLQAATPLNLGKERRLDRGHVTGFDVESAPVKEVEYWRRRALPLSLDELRLPSHVKAEGTVRPPYFDRTAKTWSWVYQEPVQRPPLIAAARTPSLVEP